MALATLCWLLLRCCGSTSLQRFLCFSCRLPQDVGGALKPGVFPTCQSGSQRLKEGSESPQMCSPSPESPARSNCQPNSPSESNTCTKNLVVGSKTGTRHRSVHVKQTDSFCFPRLKSKLRWTQRRATGKSTSTLSSTPSVQPPQSKKRMLRNQVAHPPPQKGRVPSPTHQQRSGLEKCLVRLLGKTLLPQ